MSSSFADRALLTASGAVALFALVARVHDVTAYPAIYDFDASGHAVNVIDFLEGHLPDVRSWCGSHPPLYYALGALLVKLLPETVPIHVTLRLLSAGAWFATIGLVWRALRRLASKNDAAVVAALLLGVPGMVIASCMMTNDPLCAFFVTATVVRLLHAPTGGTLPLRHVVVTAITAGLAAMTKATGLAAIGMAALFYAWRSRGNPRHALRHLAAFAIVSGVFVMPHYARLSELSGSAYEIVGTRAGSHEKEVIGHLVYAVAPTRIFSSFPALLHDAIWGDPTAVYLPRDPSSAKTALSLGGLIVTGLAAAGMVRLVMVRAFARTAAVALVFGALFAAALLPLAAYGPYLVLTKVNYFLAEALPLGILLTAGLGWLRGGGRVLLRATLVALAAGGIALTWYGWWEPARSKTPAVAASTEGAGTAVGAVGRYFEYRASDPIRTLRLLAPELHMSHDLRLVTILRVPFTPESGLDPEDERSLELARARVAWLELYNLVRWMQPMAAALDVRVLAVNQQAAEAQVSVRIGGRGAAAPAGTSIGLWPFPTFEQHFTLRHVDDTWQITSIRQSGVVNENAVQALVAAPALAALERLRSLGWTPSWEKPIAAALDALH